MKRDVLIIGAGAAGLACAQRLAQEKKDFEIVEARERVGGRVYSRAENVSVPSIEYGAEFIHGAEAQVLNRLADLQLPFVEAKDCHLYLENGKLVPVDNFWEKVEKIAAKIRGDQPLTDFFRKVKAPARDKKLFMAFVEGFHAADTSIMGTAALADAFQDDSEPLNGAEQFRPLFRYDTMFSRIAESFLVDKRLHLKTEVKRIEWKRGRVRVECTQGPAGLAKIFEARKAVVTLPIGVLKSNAVEWDPKPKGLDSALENIHMGHVQRIVFQFRNRFWEKLSDHPVAFLHAGAEHFFPTWWSLQPLRTPHLVAWQGGPKAQMLSDEPESRRAEIALKTLSLITGRSLRALNADVEAWYTHNWSEDPYSRGAYSFVGTGGMAGAKRLSRPFEDTIYLAGEGTRSGSARGTVHGALDSGWKIFDRF